MINCDNFSENICAYIDNELSIEERLSFDEHMRNCRSCKREFDEMVRIVELCTALPQQELPENFQSELHEKLLAVAGRQGGTVAAAGRQDMQDEREENATGLKKPGGFLLLKTFAVIAAGVLLVFLAGYYFRFGLFSPAKTQNSNGSTALAMEQAAEDRGGGTAQVNEIAPKSETAGGTLDQAKAFSASAAASTGTAGVDRSASAQKRMNASASKDSGSETVYGKLSTITIFVEDAASQSEKIKSLAVENGGEFSDPDIALTFSESVTVPEQSGGQTNSVKPSNSVKNGEALQIAGMPSNETTADTSPTNTSSSSPMQLSFMIPQTQYDRFVTALNTAYGAKNVQAGAIVTEDATQALKASIQESGELDSRIQELQKEDSGKNASEITKLKDEKDAVDRRIDELRLGNDFIKVTIIINGK